ncbi:hypothetical protein [Chitinimonas sp.]|uniref:hypothetical protein n=1 Tax=Chitinimonas sp. TaxID=1934313 RepID=UPI0035B1DAF4
MNDVLTASRSLGERVRGLLFEPTLPNAAPTAAVADTPVAGAPDDEAYRSLRAATLARPTEYSDLLAALDALRTVLPEGELRLNAALALLRGRGIDLTMVLRALDVHMADLETERHRFNEVALAETATAVAQPQAALQQLDATLAQRLQQLSALQAEIDQLIARRADTAQAMQGAEQRIADTCARFEAACKAVAAELEADRARFAALARA